MTLSSLWQPSAAMPTIKARADLYKNIRHFFAERNVLEVETPILGKAATVDLYIDSLVTDAIGQTRYLQTSPELFLKRLLAAGSGDIYSLGKVFRQGEKGRKHHPEFTMLEWYRLGFDEHQLMAEVSALLKMLIVDVISQKFSYQEIFEKELGFNPHQVSLDQLKETVSGKFDTDILQSEWDTDALLDLLMTHCIEPQLPQGLVFIYDYPTEKAALAQLGHNQQGQPIARRFEAYLQGIELANGYFELTDAQEQQRRFEKDLANRQRQGLPLLPYDKNLIAAMESGLPVCAGVALGVDRLLMTLLSKNKIEEVICFCE